MLLEVFLLTSRTTGLFFSASVLIESVALCFFFQSIVRVFAVPFFVFGRVRNTLKSGCHRMICGQIVGFFVWLLFLGLVCLDSRSIISAGSYLVVSLFMLSRWFSHDKQEVLVTSEYNKLMREKETLRLKVRAQKDSLERLREDNKALEKKNEQQLVEAQKQREKLEELENKAQEAMRLSQQLEEEKEKNSKLQQEYRDLERQYKESMEHHDEYSKKIEADLTRAEGQRDSLMKDLKEMEHKKNTLQSDVDQHVKTERKLDEKVERLTFKIQRLEETRRSMEEQLSYLNEELDLMKADSSKAAQAAAAAEPLSLKEVEDGFSSQEHLDKMAEDDCIPENWTAKLLESSDVAGDENIRKAFELILNGSQETEGLLDLLGQRFDDTFGPMKMTPLMYACLAGNKEAYSALMKAKPRCGLCDGHDNNILHFAVMSGNNALVSEIASNSRSLQKDENKDGVTPLQLAAQLGNAKMVEGLLPDSWKVGNTRVETVLHAVMQPLHKLIDNVDERVAIVNLVLERSKDKKATVNACDRNGNTPLHLACRQDCPKLVEVLLEAGADASKPNGEGKLVRDFALSARVRQSLGDSVLSASSSF